MVVIATRIRATPVMPAFSLGLEISATKIIVRMTHIIAGYASSVIYIEKLVYAVAPR